MYHYKTILNCHCRHRGFHYHYCCILLSSYWFKKMVIIIILYHVVVSILLTMRGDGRTLGLFIGIHSMTHTSIFATNGIVAKKNAEPQERGSQDNALCLTGHQCAVSNPTKFQRVRIFQVDGPAFATTIPGGFANENDMKHHLKKIEL